MVFGDDGKRDRPAGPEADAPNGTDEATHYGAAPTRLDLDTPPPAEAPSLRDEPPPPAADPDATRYAGERPGLQTPTPTPPGSSSSSLSADMGLPRPFGGYELLAPLGRGGMGVVYRARQLAPERLVALKMIRSGELATEEDVRRFRLEANEAARLDHPNIVPVYEVGEHQGRHFFTMRLIEGGGLDRRLDRFAGDPAAAARLVAAVARAIHHAHQRQVLHRDLKPANILLDAEGRPHVADFGLAKRLGGEGEASQSAGFGTPEYMAPEQARGEARLTTAADVYALGGVLYALLAGRPPFRGASHWETIEQVLVREPAPPSEHRPGCPRDLETVCLKCLEKEPARRYGSAEGVADDLERWLRGEPITARPVGRLERAAKWVRRQPAQATLAAALALAVLAGSAGAVFYGLYRDKVAADLARQADDRQRATTFWQQGLDREAGGQLAEARENYGKALAILHRDAQSPDDKLRPVIERQAERVKLVLDGQAGRRRERLLADQFFRAQERIRFHEFTPNPQLGPEGAAQVGRLAAEALALWGIAPAGGPADAAALAAHQRRLDAPEARRLAAGCYEVLLSWARAEAGRAPPGAAADDPARVRHALRLLDAAGAVAAANKLPPSPTPHALRARCLARLGRKQEARRAWEDARRARPATESDFVLTALEEWQRGRTAEAARACREALRRQPGHFWAQYLQALCYLRDRHWEEAQVGLTACLGSKPDAFWPRLFRASALTELGHFDLAGEDFTACLKEAGEEPFSRCIALTNRSVFWARQRCWDRALEDLREATRLQPRVPYAYVSLAELYRARKDFGAAGKALDQALACRGEDAGLYYRRAQVRLEGADWEGARGDLEKVIALEGRGRPSRRLASACVGLARLRDRTGDHAGALAAAADALRAWPHYAAAHGQRAQSLAALGQFAKAGEELDLCLAAEPKPPAAAYSLRGLIHTRLRQYPEAVEAYTRALLLKPDSAAALTQRGWVYLKLRAPAAALADFRAALRRDGARADALCGQAHALLYQGRLAEAVDSAREALRHGPRSEGLLLRVACFYARAVRRAADRPGPGTPARHTIAADHGRALEYRDRALALLEAALKQVPADRRPAFWRQNVATAPELEPIRSSEGWVRLWQTYGR
jgi:tetratricopeptide (TPR) repeat protein